MAGGGSLTPASRGKRGKHSKRKKSQRIGFHVDMTPLVDITFLLLTFFLFTTTMLKPQIMEMRIPPEMHEQVEVRESQLMVLMIDKDGDLFVQLGGQEIEPLPYEELRDFVVEQNLRPDVRNELITFLKIADDTKYESVIRVLDELNLAEIPITLEVRKETDPETGEPVKRQRRFTIGELTLEDIENIGAIKDDNDE